jgi:hypothetical protein
MGVSSTCWMKRRKTLAGKDTTPLTLSHTYQSDWGRGEVEELKGDII